MRTTRLPLLLAICAASGAAHAQWSGDATMDLGTGYGQTAMSQSTLDGTRRIDGQRRHRQAAAVQQALPTPADRKARMQLLEAEYNRRVQRDGRASADAWLRQAAYAMGQRDGRTFQRASDR